MEIIIVIKQIIITTAEGLLVVSLGCARKVRRSLAAEFTAAAQQLIPAGELGHCCCGAPVASCWESERHFYAFFPPFIGHFLSFRKTLFFLSTLLPPRRQRPGFNTRHDAATCSLIIDQIRLVWPTDLSAALLTVRSRPVVFSTLEHIQISTYFNFRWGGKKVSYLLNDSKRQLVFYLVYR